MRLGIYCFYMADGIADAGDLVYLKAMAAELDELIIVVNGKLAPESKVQLERYSKKIFYRENRGLDAGAFREVLLEHLSAEIWGSIDELVLFNNTVYGPMRSLAPLFSSFSAAAVDFWGITKYLEGDLPVHIQSYFLVFKKRVLQSNYFWEFWRNLRMDFTDPTFLIASYEVRLTSYLVQHGFQYDVVDHAGCQIYVHPLFCLQQGLPVLKKKNFRCGARISAEEYKVLFQLLDKERSEIADAIRKDMKRHHFVWENATKGRGGHLCWPNDMIWDTVQPYKFIVAFGLTVHSFYVMSQIQDKECCFVESDRFYHGEHQGSWHVWRWSELPEHLCGDDSVLVVFLQKKTVDALRSSLEERFAHILYLCDPPVEGERGKME